MSQNVVSGHVIISHNSSTIEVNGLVIVGNSTLSAPSGNVVVSGTLQIDLGEKPEGTVIFNVVQGSIVTGEFSEVFVSAPNLLACEMVEKEVTYNQNYVSVTLSVDMTGCGTPISVGGYVGIALGVILVGVGIAVAVGLYRHHKKQKFTEDAQQAIMLRQADGLENQMKQAILQFNKDSSNNNTGIN